MLPHDPERMRALATAMRLSPEQFNQTLADHRKFVAETFRNAFRIAGIADETDQDQTATTGAAADGSNSQGSLAGAPAIDPASNLEQVIQYFGEDAPELTRRVESFFDDL